MPQIKVILIDPYKKEIRITRIEDDLHSLQKAIGCSILTVGGDVTDSDIIYVDDEGLLKNDDRIPGLLCEEWNPGPLAGKCLIVGSKNGDTVSVSDAAVKKLHELNAAGELVWVSINPSEQEFYRDN